VPYRDGPYLVRGAFSLRDQDGTKIDTSRRTVALCRCGKSRTRPFCDGTHRLIRFKVASEAERPDGQARQARGRARPSSGSSSDRVAKVATNGAGPSFARPVAQTARARNDLRRADDLLRRLLEGRRRARDDAGLRAAGALVTAVCRLMDELAESAAPPRATEELAACLCLVHGALDALSVVPGGGNEDVRGLIAQLRTVAGYLDLPREGCDDT
jgi:CDGSH-type Zn-finger protein